MSTEKLQQSQLQQSASDTQNVLNNVNQTHKNLKNLFYIKSKHTKKYFNNHPYFRSSTQMNQDEKQTIVDSQQQITKLIRIPIINYQRLKTQSIAETTKKSSTKRIHTQFVNLPTQYGIENAYNFMQSNTFLGNHNNINSMKKLKENRYNNSLDKNKRVSLKYSKISDIQCDLSDNGKHYMRATAAYESRLFYTVQGKRAKGISLGVDEAINKSGSTSLKTFQLSNKLIFNTSQRRRVSLSVTKQPQLHQSKLSQDQKQLIQSNVIYNNPMVRRPSINFNNLPASHQVKFLYGKRLRSIHQIPYRFVAFDLFQSIISTFLKCRIHYKDMNQNQYNFVLTHMKRVLKENKKKQKYDIKDIINISTMKELMNFMKQYTDEDYETTEIIRYFFLLNDQKVLDYHLQKVKQDVANFISIKFDAEFGKKDLFLFDLETKNQVTNFYDLLKGQKFIIDDDQNVMNDYISLQNKQTENQHMESKIKKWKSLAECSTISSVKNSRLQNPTEPLKKQSSKDSSQSKITPLTVARKLSDQKFNLIFQQFKIRQQKRMSKHINLGDSRSNTHKSKDLFIERSRLKKQQDFFQ